MHEIGRSGLVHWDDPEGWDAEGGGKEVQDGGHEHPWLFHVSVWQNHYNIVNNSVQFSGCRVRLFATP